MDITWRGACHGSSDGLRPDQISLCVFSRTSNSAKCGPKAHGSGQTIFPSLKTISCPQLHVSHAGAPWSPSPCIRHKIKSDKNGKTGKRKPRQKKGKPQTRQTNRPPLGPSTPPSPPGGLKSLLDLVPTLFSLLGDLCLDFGSLGSLGSSFLPRGGRCPPTPSELAGLSLGGTGIGPRPMKPPAVGALGLPVRARVAPSPLAPLDGALVVSCGVVPCTERAPGARRPAMGGGMPHVCRTRLPEPPRRRRPRSSLREVGLHSCRDSQRQTHPELPPPPTRCRT